MATHTVTPATAFLTEHGVEFTEHAYDYVDHGGTAVSSSALGVPEHEVVKTLVMQTEAGDPLIVLMHGDRKVSTRELARAAGVKRIFPCKPEEAQRHSGYMVGGVSPFGTRKPLPVYLERSVLAKMGHITVPVYVFTGWEDMYSRGDLWLIDGLASRDKLLVIDASTHHGTSQFGEVGAPYDDGSGVGFSSAPPTGEDVAWLDRFLKAARNGCSRP